MLYRHGLRGHGRGAPLRGRHGLILPVVASSQLLLSRLAPMHIWPEGEDHSSQNEHTVGLFVDFVFSLVQPVANFSNKAKTLPWRNERFYVVAFSLLLFFIFPLSRIMN